MSTEQQIEKFTETVMSKSTFLLLIAVFAFFLTNLFGVYIGAGGTTDAYILGSTALAGSNLVVLPGAGSFFAVIGAILIALMNLCAGLSFAAVCFDESKNIYFRVVAVAALMLIIYGGLNIM
ncbi:MAG: hypothetical protein ACXAC8_08940 [Candidatus Hodarchaeales archaeon]|jgi:hypothetical protein